MAGVIYKHIMLADDDIDDIDLFEAAVTACSDDIKVTTATDGLLLLDLIETESVPDVIVLDFNMPRMNGSECLKAIRQKEAYRNVPVMILSTSTRERDKESCIMSGADYYAVKPQRFDLLLKLVYNLCHGLLPEMDGKKVREE